MISGFGVTCRFGCWAAMAENGQGVELGKHVTQRRVANPAPLGLMSFALTTFVLSCCNAGIFGVSATSPANVVTGLALFYGGLAQVLAGMWEFTTGNTFGATAFASYGAFWLSYAAILVPWFGVAEGFLGHEQDLAPAVAVFLLGWTIFTFLMWLGTLRSNLALSALFASLTLTFLLLTIAEYKHSTPHGLRVKRVTKPCISLQSSQCHSIDPTFFSFFFFPAMAKFFHTIF
jgi:succinate-acetate transporter protein